MPDNKDDRNVLTFRFQTWDKANQFTGMLAQFNAAAVRNVVLRPEKMISVDAVPEVRDDIRKIAGELGGDIARTPDF